MMEQRSQMLRQMRLTKTEREREVSGRLGSGQGRAGGRVRPLETSSGGGVRMTHLSPTHFPKAC